MGLPRCVDHNALDKVPDISSSLMALLVSVHSDDVIDTHRDVDTDLFSAGQVRDQGIRWQQTQGPCPVGGFGEMGCISELQSDLALFRHVFRTQLDLALPFRAEILVEATKRAGDMGDGSDAFSMGSPGRC